MSKITKLLFTISEKGNPMAKLWVDDMNTNNTSEAITIAIKSQVAFLFFLGKNTEVQLKKSGEWTNIVIDQNFSALFENAKTLKDPTHKMIAIMLNNAFDNAFASLEFLKNGEITNVCLEEFTSICKDGLAEMCLLESIVLDFFKNSRDVPKSHKKTFKVFEKEDAKQSELKDAHYILSDYEQRLDRKCINNNKLRLIKSE